MVQHRLLLLHASRASVDAVAEFYLHHAPELKPVNVLDEGVMGCLRRQEWPRAIAGLQHHIQRAKEEYSVDAALVTCSALGPAQMQELRANAGIPLLKIDEPMLENAARDEGPIGLIATFPSTVDTSLAWLRHFNPELKVQVALNPQALEALLRGDRSSHDAQLLQTAELLARNNISKIILAQVSMARLAGDVQAKTGLETLESLGSSLAGVRSMIS